MIKRFLVQIPMVNAINVRLEKHYKCSTFYLTLQQMTTTFLPKFLQIFFFKKIQLSGVLKIPSYCRNIEHTGMNYILQYVMYLFWYSCSTLTEL